MSLQYQLVPQMLCYKKFNFKRKVCDMKAVNKNIKLLVLFLIAGAFAQAEQTPGPEVQAAIKELLPLGEHKNEEEDCSVNVEVSDRGIMTVTIDNPNAEDILEIDVFDNLETNMEKTETTLLVDDEEYDGDEARGGYLINDQMKVEKQEDGSLLVSGTQTYYFEDESIDDEVLIETSCTVTP